MLGGLDGVEFDRDKDEANVAKHGISLARVMDFFPLAAEPDERHDYGEPRFRAWGTIDGGNDALAFTGRGNVLRPISLRRAHTKEMKRHVPDR